MFDLCMMKKIGILKNYVYTIYHCMIYTDINFPTDKNHDKYDDIRQISGVILCFHFLAVYKITWDKWEVGVNRRNGKMCYKYCFYH